MISASKKKLIIDHIRNAQELLADGKVRFAIDKIIAGLIIDKAYMFEYLKKSGILRHSTYLEKRNVVPGIAEALLRHKDTFAFTNTESAYFSSLITFEYFFKEMKKVSKYIDAELVKFKGNGKLKAILAKNDSNFLVFKDANRQCEDLSKAEYFNKEEISDGVSFLLSRYAERFGVTDKNLEKTDVDYAVSPAIDKLLTEAARFKSFLELEIEIESFGFICIKKNGAYWIDHPDQEFIKTLEISNILYKLRDDTNTISVVNQYSQVPTLSEIAAEFYLKNPGIFILQEYPYPRFILTVPETFYDTFLKGEMHFVLEEFAIIAAFQKELLIKYEQLISYDLRPGLTFLDFFKMHRFFIIQHGLFSYALHKEIDNVDDKILYDSLIVSFKKEELINILSRFTDHKKAEIFLDMISWDTKDIKKFLDIQYRPIISYQDNLFVQTSIMGISNLLRNIFPSESRNNNNIKGLQMSKHTSIPDTLSRVFNDKGFIVAKEVPVHFKGCNQAEGDIDFLAYRDGMLFIAECKDSIHPTDLFELRTTYNHIRKAATQLDYLLEALKDPLFNSQLCNRIGAIPGSIKIIETAIVMSNSKFWGYHIGPYPVRDVNVLSAFVRTGNRNMSLYDDKITIFKTWKGDKFNIEDLIHFLSKDGPHKAVFDSCNERKYKFGPNLYKKFYSVFLNEVYDNLKKNYRYELKEM
jgi:hypothetical protein